ncbi:MAG: hypothetical protein LBD96_05430 [Treponema sp.]|nr:hypothetical protein [Treponema sp.]
MSGTWEGKVLGAVGFSNNYPGFTAISAGNPLLFTQEANLNLDLRIKRRWFLEARFLDNLNTYVAGYRGEPGETVQYLGLGNTGLDFPSFPYLDLGGDSPSSIGLYGRFGTENLVVHSLFRYDMAIGEERVFLGNRERRQVWLSLDAMERGRSFVLPDEGLDSPPELYVEDGKGEFRDSRGKRWRKLGAGEYGAGTLLGLVELSSRPGTAVAVSYSKNGDPQPWETSLGDYDTGGPDGSSLPDTGSGFLGEVSRAFGPEVDLRLWPQPGESPGQPGKPGRDRLNNGTDILIIWERGGFSPFECMNRYRSPTSTVSSAGLLRLSGASGGGSAGERTGELEGYDLFPRGESPVDLSFPDREDRAVWELQVSGNGSRPRDPRSRWPLLAGGYTELYLPGNLSFSAGMALCFTGYGNAGDLVIGNDVVPGSIRIYRGVMEDGEFSYEEGTGRVVLRRPPAENETIRISYLKRGQDGRSGSIAAGLGAEYRGTHFGVRAALGFRQNLDRTYADGEDVKRGSLGLGTEASWDYGDFSARLRGGLEFDIPRSADLYRAAGMEGEEHTLPLSAAPFIPPLPGGLAAFSPSVLNRGNRAKLVYRNYRENRIGGSVLMFQDWEGAALIAEREGPYPVRDRQLSSQVLAAEFSFDTVTAWTGFQIPLQEAAALLEGAKLVEIPFRLDGFDTLSAASFPSLPPAAAGNGHGGDFSVVVQFGALRDGDQDFDEYPAALVEKQIYPQPGNVNPNNPAAYGEEARIALVQFSDEDRRKLRGATAMRLLIIKNSGLSRSFGGRVMLGTPILRGASFRAVIAGPAGISAAHDQPGGSGAAAVERVETGSGSLESAYPAMIRRLHPGGGQRILELRWNGLGTQAVGLEGRIARLPLRTYRSLNFFIRVPFAIPAGTLLRFFLARGPESLSPWPRGKEDEIVLEAEIPLDALPVSSWSKVELRYGDAEIRVNGAEITGGTLRYRPAALSEPGIAGDTTIFHDNAEGDSGPGGRGTYILVALEGAGSAGSFTLDEIILEDSLAAYQVSAGATLRWNREETLASYRDIPLLGGFRLGLDLENTLRASAPDIRGEGQLGYAGRSSGETTVLGTKLSAYLGFSGLYEGHGGGNTAVTWYGGHGFSRFVGPLGLDESFSYGEFRTDHRVSLELRDPAPFHSKISATVACQDETRERRWDISLNFDPPESLNFLPVLSLGGGLAWSGEAESRTSSLSNYGKSWLKTWSVMIPRSDRGEGERRREGRGSALVSKNLGALGLALSLEGKITALVPQTLSRSEALARLDIPLRLGSAGLDLRGERALLRDLRAVGKDGLEDAEIFGAFLVDTLPLSIPLYALWDGELPGRLEKSGPEGTHEYSRFRDSVSLSLNLPPGLNSFWIPLGITAALGRTVEKKLDTVFDLPDFSGIFSHSSANLFGAWGRWPLFLFYCSDEFEHTLETSAAFPRGGGISWRLVSSARLGFFGFAGGNFSLSNRLTIGTYQGGTYPRNGPSPPNWVESLELRWERPSQRGLIKALWDYGMAVLQARASWLVLADIPEAPYENRLKEHLELALDHSDDYLNVSLKGGHESHIIISGRLDFSVFLELGCLWDEKTGKLSVSFSTGTGLKVSF